MEGDGFVLLVDIFEKANFKEVTSEKFIVALFGSLGYI